MQEKIKNLIKEAGYSGELVVTHSKNLNFGEYSVFLKDAEKFLGPISENLPPEIQKVELRNNFLNFFLSRKFFAGRVEEILNKGENLGKNNLFAGKKIMVEYTDPNPFKPFHIGHLMTNAIGESIARILEHSGAKVSRANYQGDIGLHVAKAIYGLLKNPQLGEKMGTLAMQSENIGKAYSEGAGAYDSDTQIEAEIDEINKKIYARDDEKINELYDWGFKVTMEAFEDLYKMLGTKFNFYFLESQMAPIGERVVRENMGVFEESDPEPEHPSSTAKLTTGQGARYGAGDAIIFKGEKYDPKLHTRVFITSKGLPTYETKELGLTEEKFKVVPDMNLSVVVTANEQADYMKVVAKALSLIHPEYTDKMKHVTHGMMRLATGKMSSRKGKVVTGESLIRDTIALVKEKIAERDWDEEMKSKIAEVVGVSAVKYSILKQSTGGDIMYDFDKSISFEGDSGPYLQYSYARANSVLEKAKKENILPDPHAFGNDIYEVEKLLYKFPEVVHRSTEEYEPHYIASYLIEVARALNNFYWNTNIVKKKNK